MTIVIQVWLKTDIFFCISGQHKRSLTDVKEDAAISEGAEHGDGEKRKLDFSF